MSNEVPLNPVHEKNTIPMPNKPTKKVKEEQGGPKGLEPTRYGDWEINGRVSDF